ncbi:hypothetical protein ADIS_2679 [Lunatimonas lonarensis]|uniref:Uncharacterized protein n=1 Tax=Lunatimonas lonarensis TaxID=1232681 RepID=R7ZRY5_9BACT|nr:Ig-like domain-containing protein [Lunatimonas lonarensis]EON76808.1 hypothetical protein ADIS_2679 [Lunatimonas lonarensis]
MKAGWMKIRSIVFIYLHIGVFFGVSGQVVINQTTNSISIQEIRLSVDGYQIIQTTNPATRTNPLPDRSPVVVETILLENGVEIFATTRTPIVQNLHPRLGTNQIPANGVGVAKYDGTYISHMNANFAHAIEDVVSTPDFRSYWDIGGSNIPANEVFLDVIYPVEIPQSGYLVVSERDGNSRMNFQALDISGQPILSAQTIELRGYSWNMGVVNQGNYPTQPQHLVVFSPLMFGSSEPIFGIRVINIDGADGKIVFFRNSIQVVDDVAPVTTVGVKNITNVLLNDELMEQPVSLETVTLSVIEPDPNGWVRLNADGSVDVSADAEPGIYVITYQITEIGNWTNSAYGTVTVEVITSLPVNWLSVDAHASLSGATISWSVSQEKNNEMFQIARSTDGAKSFELIGEVPGGMNTSSVSHYQFFDPLLPDRGTIYYKVQQVDFDGKTSSSELARLTRDFPVQPTARVFPNPYVGGRLEIAMPMLYEKQYGTLSLKSGSGHILVYHEGILGDIKPVFLTSLEEVDAGLYVVGVVISGRSEILKWVKR